MGELTEDDLRARPSRRMFVGAAVVALLVLAGTIVLGVVIDRHDDPEGHLADQISSDAADHAPGLLCGTTIDTSFPTITSAPDQLVATDPLRSVTVCRYGGVNTASTDGGPQVGQLQQSGTVTDEAEMSALVSAANSGQPVPTGPISCPADFGIYYIVGFRYVDAPLESVVVGGSGCRFAQNGSAGHWASPELTSAIAAIAGEPQ